MLSSFILNNLAVHYQLKNKHHIDREFTRAIYGPPAGDPCIINHANLP